MIHTVQYAGFPRALNAIRVVTDALKAYGQEIPPALGPLVEERGADGAHRSQRRT